MFKDLNRSNSTFCIPLTVSRKSRASTSRLVGAERKITEHFANTSRMQTRLRGIGRLASMLRSYQRSAETQSVKTTQQTQEAWRKQRDSQNQMTFGPVQNYSPGFSQQHSVQGRSGVSGSTYTAPHGQSGTSNPLSNSSRTLKIEGKVAPNMSKPQPTQSHQFSQSSHPFEPDSARKSSHISASRMNHSQAQADTTSQFQTAEKSPYSTQEAYQNGNGERESSDSPQVALNGNGRDLTASFETHGDSQNGNKVDSGPPPNSRKESSSRKDAMKDLHKRKSRGRKPKATLPAQDISFQQQDNFTVREISNAVDQTQQNNDSLSSKSSETKSDWTYLPQEFSTANRSSLLFPPTEKQESDGPNAYEFLKSYGPQTSDLRSNTQTSESSETSSNISDQTLYDPDLEKERLKAEILREGLHPGVLKVDDLETAKFVSSKLIQDARQNPGLVFACDTEVAHIDVTSESPVNHGTVICFSIFGGPDLHFAPEEMPSNKNLWKNQIWVDTYFDGNDPEKGREILSLFREFFEDKNIKKVWHNYSFDRHVMGNMDIVDEQGEIRKLNCQGMEADTMHMARLWDSSRKGSKTYSLASLTSERDKLMKAFKDDSRGKLSMKELFGVRKLTKSGTPGKLVTLPNVEELQTSESTKDGWINYSAFDAKATHELYEALKTELQRTHWIMDSVDSSSFGIKPDQNMFDFYQQIWKPFGELLTSMEKTGFLVNKEHLRVAQEQAEDDQSRAENRFRGFVSTCVKDAQYMNPGSGPQIRQLLFAGAANSKPGNKGEYLELKKVFKAENKDKDGNPIIPGEGKKKAKKHMDINLHGLWGEDKHTQLEPEVFTPSGWPAVSTPVLRSLAGKPGAAKKALGDEDDGLSLLTSDIESGVGSIEDSTDESNIIAAEEEEEDELSTDWEEIQNGNGKKIMVPKSLDIEEEAAKLGFGKLYAAFGGGTQGTRACAAVDALCEVGAIDTLLSNFIVPLQETKIASHSEDPNYHRVHCSLNINTETGRLSCRRPNLQNQPALEKDRYKVRQAFTADVRENNTLVVADYGQLELRILAHMTDCKSMIEAFRLGGDFHSRTALGMYDHIKEAIAEKKCILEWDGPKGTKSPVPLLKDMFASERRKAKVLNFSIAYGKTAHGLSKDWGVSLEEAQATVDRWYADRPEVRSWQKNQQKMADSRKIYKNGIEMDGGYVRTILGRRRQLHAYDLSGAAKGHALRAAINTPIQGSAADIATAAMLRINECPKLKQLGFKLLLQVHDEVILEGPKKHAEEARNLVVYHMSHPFGPSCPMHNGNPLRVDLVVDAKFADTWYEAK